MAITTLSKWPFFVFAILEPVALVWAYIVGMADPFQYLDDQIPNKPLKLKDFNPQSEALTLQLINVLLLLAGVALVCCCTTSPSVTRNYLIIVAFADYGHIYAVYKAMGDDFWNVGEWNQMVMGNVGASVFLNINRWLTVLGAFGGLKQRVGTKKNV